MIYQTFHHTVDSVALTLCSEDAVPLNIRPKTCQLLVLLLESAGQPLSKKTLLETVWADSVVSEQVVFQSINEIRRLFGNSDVIKTIPQQGYVWLPNVAAESPKTQKQPFKFSYIAACLGLILLLTMSVFWFSDEAADHSTVAGSVVVLPTINKIQGNDHDWVRLGMMDQVIQRLPNSNERAVLQTDYVLEVIKRAKSKFERINDDEIRQMFLVSGAELIVTSLLSGTPFEYELNYRFYTRISVSQGVILDSDVQSLIDKFSQLVANRIGEEPLKTSESFHKDFNSNLLGRAIELRLERNFEAAQPLLHSLVINEPENLTARRLLANNLLILGELKKGDEQLDLAIPMAKQQSDQHELARLLLAKAYLYRGGGDLNRARSFAHEAIEVTEQENDWLYMAHSKSLLAQMAMSEQNFSQAQTLFLQAKQHHQVLRCPVGESISWINLALLAKRQNKPLELEQALTKAENIAQNRALNRQVARINKIRNSL